MNPTIGDVDQVAEQDYVPSIAGMGMEKTITVFNPMPADFRVKYTRSVATNAPLTPEMQYTKEKTGLDLSRRGTVSGHVSHSIVLKAKSLTNLPGDIAQIAVQKLINVIIQTRNPDGSYDFEGRGGNKGMVPDPHLRATIEQEIVREIKDTMSLMNRETPEQFTERQLGEMNDFSNNGEEPSSGETDEPPAPGTGRNYTAKTTVPGGAEQPIPEEPRVTPNPAIADKPKRGRPKAAVTKA